MSYRRVSQDNASANIYSTIVDALLRIGCEVSGTFHCRKSIDNSRELDVEIHYVVKRLDREGNLKDDTPMVIQSFKVR